ncbi:hypothetical protein E2C01_017397 [Portunus trituberculatus]|uniref:Uncharacterized protein n=1 Tax=Portunus trituberculatus TaxID=210409 RepID=A0A5B7DTB6_PORTR|nr:hypothetical protein [Portunus trituberculatus]
MPAGPGDAPTQNCSGRLHLSNVQTEVGLGSHHTMSPFPLAPNVLYTFELHGYAFLRPRVFGKCLMLRVTTSAETTDHDHLRVTPN